MASDYEGQDRGSAADYARYLAGMDASMRQKVALTAAHLLCEGRVADMGTGSGGASHAFAQLYPRLEVVGVDVSETMVALARERFQLARLLAITDPDNTASQAVLEHVGFVFERHFTWSEIGKEQALYAKDLL